MNEHKACALAGWKSCLSHFLSSGALLFLVTRVDAGVLHVSHEPLHTIPINQQFRTINQAAQQVAAGDRVIIHAGIYRESVVVEESGTRKRPIVFETAPAANVTITGVDPLDEWQREEGTANIYSTYWPHRFIPWGKSDAYPEDDDHALVGRAEQVFADDYPLRQTLSRAAMERGTFFVDLDARQLFVYLHTGEKLDGSWRRPRIEAATRDVLWRCKGAYVVLRGVRFRYAANRAQQGSAIFEGEGDEVEDCIFERTNGLGAHFAAVGQVARRCVFQDNGQLGFSGLRAHSLLVTGCLIRNNNNKGFNRGWEAGGDKIVLSRNVVIERSRFVENRGVGVWFDTGNENCTVRNCLIEANEDAGLFYEISYGLHAHDNVIIRNGLAANRAAWGAQSGISLSSSPDCVVKRNLIVGNKEGISFREQPRETQRIDDPTQTQQFAIWNHDETIQNNIIAYNEDVQTRGWFAVADERLWPRKLQEESHPARAGEPGSLEALRLKLSGNTYGVRDNQALFIWGTSWMRHVSYSTISAVRRALDLEQSSHLAQLVFPNFREGDLGVLRASEGFELSNYPRGEIPGVRLGVARTR